jgi:hypothetical protein
MTSSLGLYIILIIGLLAIFMRCNNSEHFRSSSRSSRSSSRSSRSSAVAPDFGAGRASPSFRRSAGLPPLRESRHGRRSHGHGHRSHRTYIYNQPSENVPSGGPSWGQYWGTWWPWRRWGGWPFSCAEKASSLCFDQGATCWQNAYEACQLGYA